MATYKKRGSLKSKVVVENDHSNSKTAEVFQNLDLCASKAENFVAKYQNGILIFLASLKCVEEGVIRKIQSRLRLIKL